MNAFEERDAVCVHGDDALEVLDLKLPACLCGAELLQEVYVLHALHCAGRNRGCAADSLVVITANEQIIRMSVAGIRECGRGSSGVKVVDVAKNDRVISASVVPGENAEAEVAAEEAASTEPPGDGPSE